MTPVDAASPADAGDYRPLSLRGGCIDAIEASDLDRKTAIVRTVARRWFDAAVDAAVSLQRRLADAASGQPSP